MSEKILALIAAFAIGCGATWFSIGRCLGAALRYAPSFRQRAKDFIRRIEETIPQELSGGPFAVRIEEPPEQVTLQCCECAGTVVFFAPITDGDSPTAYHTLPMCARFNKLNETHDVEGLVQYACDCRGAQGFTRQVEKANRSQEAAFRMPAIRAGSPGPWHADVSSILRNLGYDTECGACMAAALTNVAPPGGEHTCGKKGRS